MGENSKLERLMNVYMTFLKTCQQKIAKDIDQVIFCFYIPQRGRSVRHP